MRTLVDLPEPDIEALDQLGRRRGASRARLIREAVAEYLGKNKRPVSEAAFGLWRGESLEGGLDYQRRVRAEW